MVKKLFTLLCTVALMLILSLIASAEVAPDGYEGLWYDSDTGYYYYCENGAEVTDDYREVEGNLYYFDTFGRSVIGGFMDNNGEAHFATQDSIVVDGTDLNLTNGYGWYYFEWYDAWYYFYQDGTVACEQLLDVGGKTYCFDIYCEMQTGIVSAYELSGDTWIYNYYVTDDNGAIIKTPGWYKYKSLDSSSDYEWCYISNTNGVLYNGFQTIKGVKYYFVSGIMMEGAFEYWDEEAEEYVFAFAKQGGAITTQKGWHKIVNTYYEGYESYSYTNWYYIDADGELLRDGFYTIDDKTYFFGYWCDMYTGFFNTSYYDEELETWIYDYYIADINGVVATKPGWAYVQVYENSSYWYYVFEDGTIANDQIVNVDGDDYYLDYLGQLRTNCDYWIDELGMFVQIDVNGRIMNKPNTWYQCYGEYYYVKEDGSLAADEILTVNGKDYVFGESGRMYVGKNYLSSTENYYYTDKDGVLIKEKWIQNNFDWYYAKEDGSLACEEWKDGTYYFNYDANMVVGTHYTHDYGYCVFDSNGKYVDRAGKKPGWQKLDGYWYYYDDVNGVNEPHNGWLKSGGNWYYFYDGRMCTDERIYDSDNYYLLDETGKMVTGWFQDIYGIWHYTDASGKLVIGWNKIGGKWYYFDDLGYMYNTEIAYLYEEGEWHKFNTSGAWIGKLTDKSWVKDSNGDWYYITQGETIDGEYDVNGKTYYFKWNRMCANENYDDVWLNANGLKDTGSGWRQDSYGYWYYLENGELAYGLRKIGSKWYYFYYEMATGYIDYYDSTTGKYEYGFFDSDGAWQNVSTGWYSVTHPYGDTSWYYFKNGEPLTTNDNYMSYQTVGSKKYLFYNDGEMFTGCYFAGNDAMYIFDENGILSKGGWVKVYDEWYYTDSTGRAYVGEHTIGGKTYYFNYYGIML